MEPAAQQPPATILVIDDEPVALHAIVAELAALGLETLIAHDGADGLRKAEQGRPDLILLDVLMPGLDGYETCRRLKASPATQGIPVLFLSVLSDINDKLAGFEAGCVDYITKPFDPREVLARVSAHLRQRALLTRLADRSGPSRQGRTVLAASKDADLGESADETDLRLVRQVIDILRDAMADPPPLTELARRVGTNHVRLGRAFQTHLGMSTFEYLREQRLAQAQGLLATTDQPVKQIAAAVRFKRARVFATAFRLRFGVTPREYRRRQG